MRSRSTSRCNVKDQLLQHGSVTRGQLGVTIQDVNQSLADSFGLKKPAGALVSSVDKDGAAAKAGLKAGDVILRYNGTDIGSSSRLPLLVADTAPGTTVKLDVMRKGETRHIDVTVGAAKGTKVASADVAGHDHGRLGVVVRPLNPDEQKQAGTGGVIVEDASGPAANAGIQPGDMILSLNGTPVSSPAQLKQLTGEGGQARGAIGAARRGQDIRPLGSGLSAGSSDDAGQCGNCAEPRVFPSTKCKGVLP